MEKYENREIEVDLKRLVVVLWRRLWLLLLVAAVGAGIAFSYAKFFVSPSYSSSVTLYVNNNYVDSPGFSSSQLTAAQDLAKTYMVIMESRNVLQTVAEQTNLGYTYNHLKGMVSATAVNETEIFEVRVTGGNYQHVTQIANAIADVLPEKITSVVEGSSVRVVDRAVENPHPVGPNYRTYLMLGAVAGFGLCLVALLVLELLDTTIYSEEYLSQRYENLPLLTVIPGAETNTKYAYKGYYETPHNRRIFPKTGGSQK